MTSDKQDFNNHHPAKFGQLIFYFFHFSLLKTINEWVFFKPNSHH